MPAYVNGKTHAEPAGAGPPTVTQAVATETSGRKRTTPRGAFIVYIERYRCARFIAGSRDSVQYVFIAPRGSEEFETEKVGVPRA